MTSERTRRAIAEVAIGLMVCAAVHMFVIAPQNAKLAKLEAEINAIAGPTSPASTLTADQLTRLTNEAAEKAERVGTLSESAKDETRLFSAIMSLAEKSGVRIDQLQPTGEPAGAPGRPPAQPAPATPDGVSPITPPPPPDHGAVGYSMVVSAAYPDLVAFLAALPRDIGFTIVRSVRAEPGDSAEGPSGQTGPARVRAHVETEHHWFDASRLRTLATASLHADAAAAPEGPR